MHKLACLAVLLSTLCLAADTPESSLPPKAILPTRAYNAALERAKARYDREVEKARREYVRDLERAKAEYMAAKDLNGAMEVQGLIEGETIVQTAIAPQNYVRVVGREVLRLTLLKDGDLVAHGPTAWKSWTSVRDGVRFNTDFHLRHVSTTLFVGRDPGGRTIYMFPELPADQ